jgi:DNA polymerase-1
LPWYEADDIIASIVTKFRTDSDLVCNVFSADKDLKQLLDENVIFTDPSKWITYKTNDFIQEFWFEPKYILDYLALIWDNADNIKWVPWIWPKWASDLIKEYKTIESIYENIDSVPWKTKEKLVEWKEFAENAKKLIQLEISPEIDEIWLEKYKLDIDFSNYKKTLVEEYNFWSMEKVITEIKNKYQMPQQTSLF